MAQTKKKGEPPLRGWSEIARYLGQPVATAQHWAKEGMPVHREGRYMTASVEELSDWVGRESGAGQPVHIAGEDADLAAELRRGLKAARNRRKIHRVK